MYIKNEICSQHLIKMEKRYIKECLKKVKERKCFVYSQVHPTSLTRHSPPSPPPLQKKIFTTNTQINQTVSYLQT